MKAGPSTQRRFPLGPIVVAAAFAGGVAAGVVNGYLRLQALGADAAAGGAYHDALRGLHVSTTA